MIVAEEIAENPNAIGIINKNKAGIIIMSVGANVIEAFISLQLLILQPSLLRVYLEEQLILNRARRAYEKEKDESNVRSQHSDDREMKCPKFWLYHQAYPAT